MLFQVSSVCRIEALSDINVLEELVHQFSFVNLHLNERLRLLGIEVVFQDCLHHVMNACCSLLTLVV